MTSHATQSFLKRFPGPYSFHPGTDGVDNTFDIYCLTTGSHIIAATYWYEVEQAELVAAVVTLALEMSRQPDAQASTRPETDAKLKAFERQHPGPYLCKEFVYDNVMAEIGVASFSEDSLIISSLDIPHDTEARQTAWHIANSLNRIFGFPAGHRRNTIVTHVRK